MNKPLVSIIIPCYNYGTFIADAVNSVRVQTYSNWECIIIDDGSVDNTAEISMTLVKSDERIIYKHKSNGGLSSARNYGINNSKGDYICFLDADDLLDKEKLDKQLSCFAREPLADIVYGNAMFFEKNNLKYLYTNKTKGIKPELQCFSGSGNMLLSLLNRQNITVVSAPLIKKEVFKSTGMFDETYKSYEDWHFWMRCALAGSTFIYESEPPVCTFIRFGHESMMSDKRKLLLAGIQLRKYMAANLPLQFRPYNYYRLLRSRIKLIFI